MLTLIFFVIDSGSGQISVDDDADLDFDAGDKQFVVMVRATDPGNKGSEIKCDHQGHRTWMKTPSLMKPLMQMTA